MTTTVTTMPVGGGGFMTRIAIANDGTKVCRTDSAQCWKCTVADPVWRLLVTGTNIVDPSLVHGAYEVDIAPSDSSRIVVLWGGHTYVSSNGGTTFTLRSSGGAGTFPNYAATAGTAGATNTGAQRLNGPHIAIDPQNPDVFYIGYPLDGVWQTTDGGVTATQMTGVPTASTYVDGNGITQSKGYALAVDGHSSLTSSRSSVVYALAEGSATYKTTNGGTSWATTGGGPTTFCRMAMDLTDNTLYVVNNPGTDQGFFYSYNRPGSANTWNGPSAETMKAVASNPSAAGKLASASTGASLYTSTDWGATWNNIGSSGLNTANKVATDAPWLAVTPEGSLSTSDIAFDKSTTDKLYLASGIGIFWTTPTSSSYFWTSQTAGIENLAANQVIATPSYAYPIGSSWDRPIFKLHPTNYPSTQKPGNNTSIVHGWSLDYASSNTAWICSIVNNENNYYDDYSGYSSDGGDNWTLFPTTPYMILAEVTSATAAGSATITIGGGFPTLKIVGRTVTNIGPMLTTNAPTTIASNVLNFASVPAWIVPGMRVYSFDNPWKMQFVTVGFTTATTVTLSGIALFGAISSGERIIFPPLSDPFPSGSQQIISSATSTTITLNANMINGGVAVHDIIELRAAMGGSIAAASPTNIIMVGQGNQSYPWYTKDGGTTWANVIVGTSTTGFDSNGAATPDASAETGWGHVHYMNDRHVCADRVTPNTFYLYNHRASADGGGVYRSINSGDTWTRRNVNRWGNGDPTIGGGGASIQSVPDFAGHLFIQGGGDPASGTIARSDDGGANWYTLANVSEVSTLGFGKAKPGGGGYPTVFFAGKYFGVYGFWRSDDMPSTASATSQTFENVGGAYPANWITSVNVIDGDKQTYGTYYLARGSTGWAMGVLDGTITVGTRGGHMKARLHFH